MTTIKNQGPKLTEIEVRQLEAKLPSPLPGAYRRFLLANNGGVPVPNVIDIPGFHGGTDVQEFFGIGLSMESSRIDWNIDTLKERLESRLLPIACDSGDNVFCLSLRPADKGVVIYCDLDAVYGDYGKVPPMYPIADFDRFLASLRKL